MSGVMIRDSDISHNIKNEPQYLMGTDIGSKMRAGLSLDRPIIIVMNEFFVVILYQYLLLIAFS